MVAAIILEIMSSPLRALLYAQGELKLFSNISLILAMVSVFLSYTIIANYGVIYITLMLMIFFVTNIKIV